jgi:hypothetical protein
MTRGQGRSCHFQARRFTPSPLDSSGDGEVPQGGIIATS